MKNIRITKFLTEATIASMVLVYSYVVYLAGELGYLHALGVTGGIALITLDIQGVILGLASALGYLITFLFILGGGIYLLNRLVLRVPYLRRINSWAESTVIVGVLLAMVLPQAYTMWGRLGAALVAIFVISITMATVIRWPGQQKSAQDTYLEGAYGTMKRYIKDRKLRKITVLAITIILTIPYVNYYFKYNEAALQTHKIAMTTAYQGSDYYIARTYSDKYILVQYDNHGLLPNYAVISKNEMGMIRFSAKEINANSARLHPKPSRLVQLTEFIKKAIGLSGRDRK